MPLFLFHSFLPKSQCASGAAATLLAQTWNQKDKGLFCFVLFFSSLVLSCFSVLFFFFMRYGWTRQAKKRFLNPFDGFRSHYPSDNEPVRRFSKEGAELGR